MAESVSSGHPPFWRASWRAPLMALGMFVLLLIWKWLAPPNRAAAVKTRPGDIDMPEQRNEKTAFETTDWQLAPIAGIYIGVLVLLVISCCVLIVAYPASLPDVGRTLRISPPGPRLQTDPASDLRAFRAEEEKRLNTYYWIDKQKGVAHIPIEQAMKKINATGIEGFQKGQQ
jgi:hypothetical protein